jgi:serine/threonine protein kinase
MDWTGDLITAPSSGSSFRIGKKIGVGNFASEGVYEAFPSNENSDLVLAIKIVKNDSCSAASKKEAEIWSSLDHKNIVKFYEYFNIDSDSFFVMEYCRNGNLLAYINSHPEGVFIPEESVAFVFNQICEGVKYMHEDAMIVHRDIKLDNILLSTDYKGHLVAKICDFGLSSRRKVNLSVSLDRCNSLRRTSCAPSTDHGGSAGRGPEREDKTECVGSLAYCAPELLDPSLLNSLHASSAVEVGSKRSFHSSISVGRNQTFSDTVGSSVDDDDFELKKAADIWALGIVLYAMLTNKLPFACEFQPRMHLMIVTGDYERIKTKQDNSSMMFNSSARLESGEPERLCSVEAKELVEGLLEMNVQQRLKIMQVLNSRFLCSKLQ